MAWHQIQSAPHDRPMRPEPRPESIRETLLLIVEREYDIPVLEALNAESTLRARVAELEARLQTIGDIAHFRSAGPAIQDDLWEVRGLAYELL